jgi:hypothetical protein
VKEWRLILFFELLETDAGPELSKTG